MFTYIFIAVLDLKIIYAECLQDPQSNKNINTIQGLNSHTFFQKLALSQTFLPNPVMKPNRQHIERQCEC